MAQVLTLGLKTAVSVPAFHITKASSSSKRPYPVFQVGDVKDRCGAGYYHNVIICSTDTRNQCSSFSRCDFYSLPHNCHIWSRSSRDPVFFKGRLLTIIKWSAIPAQWHEFKQTLAPPSHLQWIPAVSLSPARQ